MPQKIKVRIAEATKHNLSQLELLNTVVIPTKFPKSFYDQLVETWPRENYTVAYAYYFEALVGAITAAIFEIKEDGSRQIAELPLDESKKYDVYIYTLGVLEPYRRRGVADTLLTKINSFISSNSSIQSTYLHINPNNTSALAFFKKNGFEEFNAPQSDLHYFSEGDIALTKVRD